MSHQQERSPQDQQIIKSIQDSRQRLGIPPLVGPELEAMIVKEKAEHDAVNHPKHYTQHPSGIECIQITRHMGFNLGNAMKYLWRADLKNGLEDLRKAIWYIEDEIKKRGG